ncbi:hypothetical protein HanXRQr2_Chr08g0337351 [Helianthus annuus]|uniref:Uncharacterized protein n=1 Tax=Helianthus annuus TaxID=4232 RepID=A0A9K3IEH5_HELAN|nr:hypothetical protein HanXRQr2_Chr08g0337351 [Helianthus annuus]
MSPSLSSMASLLYTAVFDGSANFTSSSPSDSDSEPASDSVSGSDSDGSISRSSGNVSNNLEVGFFIAIYSP